MKKTKPYLIKDIVITKKANFELVLDENWKENFLKNIYPKI